MKYFLDTEFIEYPNTIQLISIGIKCEDGRKLYLVSNEYNYVKANEWVKENVIRPLYIEQIHGDMRNIFDASDFHHQVGNSINDIKNKVIDFIGDDTPEFWAYYGDYDWVVFCWLFGSMMDLPKNYPMYCNDLIQLADYLDKIIIDPPLGEHNALVDAEWNEKLYIHLVCDDGDYNE